MTAFLRFRLILCILSLALPGTGRPQSLSSCTDDTHIESAKRQAIDAVAMDFVGTLLGPNPSTAVNMFSQDGKANITPEQLQQATTAFKAFEPKNTTVEHTYVLKLLGKSPGRIACAQDFSKPDGWVAMQAADLPEQAYVALSAETRNNRVAFTIWLVPEQKAWKVQSFWMNVSTLADQDSVRLWQAGRAQQAKGHSFNAALLLITAAQIANRGPDFQLGITQAISEDLGKMTPPPDMQGPPPFSWKDGERTYKVLQVGPIAVGGKIFVLVAQEVSPWRSDQQVDTWNKELISYFKRRFPEYSDAFAGVIVRAHERGTNRGYGTVDELPQATSKH